MRHYTQQERATFRLATVVAIAALLGVLAWRVLGTPTASHAADVPAAALVSPVAGSPGAASVAALPPPPLAPYPERGTTGLSTDDPLTAYRKANVYPPTSRPLSIDQADLLYPNRRHETARPTDADDGVTFLFTADRYFVFGDESLTATLDVWRDGKPIAVTITRAFAAVLDPVHHDEHPIPLAFASEQGRNVAHFAPASLGLARQSAIGMYVELDDGTAKQRAHFDFQYTPAAGVPARFTGVFADAIENGSLVIHTGVEVTRAGHYVIDANLFDAADQPVAWARYKGELAAGTQDAALVFFGKVVVDQHAKGPFHIGQLRGARFDAGRDPDLEQMPPFTGRYTTAVYATDDFSSAEWDSPEKQHMIELLGSQPPRH